MIVESKTVTSPSTSAGISSRGFAAANSAPPPERMSGISVSKAIPFSMSASLTFCT